MMDRKLTIDTKASMWKFDEKQDVFVISKRFSKNYLLIA